MKMRMRGLVPCWAINICDLPGQFTEGKSSPLQLKSGRDCAKRQLRGWAVAAGGCWGGQTGGIEVRDLEGPLLTPAYSVIQSYVLWLKGVKGKAYKLTPEMFLCQ